MHKDIPWISINKSVKKQSNITQYLMKTPDSSIRDSRTTLKTRQRQSFQKYNQFIDIDKEVIKSEQRELSRIRSPNRNSCSTVSLDEEREFLENKKFFENSVRKKDLTPESNLTSEDKDTLYSQAEISEKQEAIREILIKNNFLYNEDILEFNNLISQFTDSSIIKAFKWLEQELICLTSLKQKYNHFFFKKKRLVWFLQILSAKRFFGIKVLNREAWIVIKSISFFKDLFCDFTSRQLTKAARKKIIEEDAFIIYDYEKKSILKKDELLELTNMVKGSRFRIRKSDNSIMITPLFKVDQNDNFILLSIQVKYVKISDVDFHIENNNFKFYLKPYFLNLFFSDNLKPDSENNSSSYDVEKGLLDCRIEKEVHGTEFKNLDMVSTLLVKECNPSKGHQNQNNQVLNENLISKKVQEICPQGANESNITIEEIKNNFLTKIKDEQSLNIFLLEIISKETLSSDFSEISLTQNDKKFTYGFNNEFYDVFKSREEERLELLDLNPETEQKKHRYFAKIEKENEDFVPERYYYDMNSEDNENLKSVINLSLDKYFKKHSDKDNQSYFQFNDKELNTLMTINKTKLSLLEYDTNIYFEFYLQSIDILFAFIYDLRLTEFEHNSESGWTINKLSSVLSNCVDYKNIFYSFSDVPPFEYLEESVRNVIISCFRRALTHPLYRNLEICEKIKNDLVKLFSKENNAFFILKFFLRVRQIFESSEPRHILNRIYIDGYIQWVQSYSIKEIWKILGDVIMKIEISKDEIKLDLNEIENEFKNYEGDI